MSFTLLTLGLFRKNSTDHSQEATPEPFLPKPPAFWRSRAAFWNLFRGAPVFSVTDRPTYRNLTLKKNGTIACTQAGMIFRDVSNF